jgi:hypothetical protein
MSNKMLFGMLFSNRVYLLHFYASAFLRGGSPWIEEDFELKNMANLMVKS